jgi:hypothetical protein
MGGSADGVPDDQGIGVHGLEGEGGILDIFPFLQTAPGLSQGKGVRRQAFGRDIKGCLGPGAGLSKQENDAFSLQGRCFLYRSVRHFGKPFGKLEYCMDIIGREIGNGQQV